MSTPIPLAKYEHHKIAQIKHFSLQIALSGSLYTLMAIALERYLNICKHANYSVWVRTLSLKL